MPTCFIAMLGILACGSKHAPEPLRDGGARVWTDGEEPRVVLQATTAPSNSTGAVHLELWARADVKYPDSPDDHDFLRHPDCDVTAPDIAGHHVCDTRARRRADLELSAHGDGLRAAVSGDWPDARF